MPRSEVLYCKGMDVSESEACPSGDDRWDDTQLNNAYDKALKIANIDVAQRIAMSTNNHEGKEKAHPKQKSKKVNKKRQWKTGMPCRAIYEGDGLEYEAFVLRFVNDEECIVRFLGYDNSEIVAIDSMTPSQGKEAQQRQIEQASLEKGEDSDTNTHVMDCEPHSEAATSTESPERSFQKKAKKKRHSISANNFKLPNIPMPDINKLRQQHSSGMPITPPPMAFTSSVNNEEQAVSNMLLSWYMSGYYTGLYQGLKRASSSQNQSKDKN